MRRSTTSSSSVRSIDTPVGEARVDISRGTSTRVTLVLGHGAGGGIGARDLEALAGALPDRGVTVMRVEQPWHVAGRKVATAPPTLDVAWSAVLAELDVTGPLVVGGRSAGARVACRTAVAVGAVGVLALAFPLHPPGRPEKSRLAELTGCGGADAGRAGRPRRVRRTGRLPGGRAVCHAPDPVRRPQLPRACVGPADPARGARPGRRRGRPLAPGALINLLPTTQLLVPAPHRQIDGQHQCR